MKINALLNASLLLLFQTSEGFTAKMAAKTPTTEVKILGGVSDLIESYDTFLLDMWGVMHDGTTTYEGVLDVVAKLVKEGKDVKILSNSSKRQSNSIKMLKKLGFDPSNFSQIITSGEVAYHMLSATSPDTNPLAPQPWNVIDSISSKKVFCFGSGDGDEDYLTSCGWTLAGMEEADLVVARGTFTINDGKKVIHKNHDGEDAYFEAYHEQIAKAAERRIPMIVANPDKIRPDADRSPMPGTIGNAYEKALGGDGTDLLIKYIGKPFSDVYEIALRNQQDRTRAVMIGDALETDIAGATAESIDSVWVVNDGIHNIYIEEKGKGNMKTGCEEVLEEFNQLENTYAKGQELVPTVVLPHFRW